MTSSTSPQPGAVSEHAPHLLILPALAGRAADGGRFILTRKFIDGAAEYARRWSGPVTVAIERTTNRTSNLDEVEVRASDLPFGLQWLPERKADLDRLFASASVAMISLVDKNLGLADSAHRRAVPVVWVTEYSVLTRRQIIWTETANPILRWRREWYNRQMEHKFVRAIRGSTGVQCNGTPTYDAYSGLVAESLLYFDTRVRAEQLASPAALESRIRTMLDGSPLRLAFSGRFVAMKGSDHLPKVAEHLRSLDVPFRFDVCGGGPLEAAMRQEIGRASLGDHFHFRGVLDFQRELVPLVSNEVDLFVCCHRQGDPSCTYLETMSCGTPIAGYDNEAFAGLVRTSGVGWMSPMDQPRHLAELIAQLHGNRPALAEAARRSLEFARQHTFERTMQVRVDHLRRCAASRGTMVKAS